MYALGYAHQGLRVFPLHARGKAPLFPNAHPVGDPLHGICKGECGRLGHGFHDATTDEAKIRAWWEKRPDANIGINPDADLVVVDVDSEEAFKRLAAEGLELPETARQVTQRGKHFFYRVSEPLSKKTLFRTST